MPSIKYGGVGNHGVNTIVAHFSKYRTGIPMHHDATSILNKIHMRPHNQE